MKNIHLIPTSKPSKLKQNKITKKLSLVNKGIDLTAYTPINIYITSDEEIKEGDWYISILENEVYKATNETQNIMSVANLIGTTTYKNTHFKIILTTDQSLDGVQAIDNEFLEWFVKNPSCEEVEVVIMNEGYDKSEDVPYQECYKIIIPKEEPKQETGKEFYESADKVITVKRQETLEEVAHKMLDDYGIKSIGQSIGVLEVKKLMVKMAKWQAERMYEIMNAYTDDVMGGCNLRAEEWFEQNKNK